MTHDRRFFQGVSGGKSWITQLKNRFFGLNLTKFNPVLHKNGGGASGRRMRIEIIRGYYQNFTAQGCTTLPFIYSLPLLLCSLTENWYSKIFLKVTFSLIIQFPIE